MDEMLTKSECLELFRLLTEKAQRGKEPSNAPGYLGDALPSQRAELEVTLLRRLIGMAQPSDPNYNFRDLNEKSDEHKKQIEELRAFMGTLAYELRQAKVSSS